MADSPIGPSRLGRTTLYRVMRQCDHAINGADFLRRVRKAFLYEALSVLTDLHRLI